EALEDRTLLSGGPSIPDSAGLTPAQIRKAYGMDRIYFSSQKFTGDGTGQTIAIIVSYDAPAFVDSSDPNFMNSDLHNFSVAAGLPDPPNFTKVDQNGGTSYPVVDPAKPDPTNPDPAKQHPVNWEAETALDVEWAHAAAPQANILLVEANNSDDARLAAARFAAQQPGVSVVS